MEKFLKQFFRNFKGKQIKEKDFEREVSKYFGEDLSKYFKAYIY